MEKISSLMKKIIGLISYISSLPIVILWILGLWDLIFNTCRGCLLASSGLIPWWQNPSGLVFILGYPTLAIMLFIVGKELRK